MKKMQMILLALGLSLTVALFMAGCSEDNTTTPTEDPPNAPTGVQAALIAPTLVRVTWSASPEAAVQHLEDYVIERRATVEESYSEIGSVDAETLSYDDSTADRGVTYQYRVGAHGEGGTTYSESAPSVSTPSIQESTVGIWWDTNAFEMIGEDSVKFEFNSDNTFRRTEYYHTLDAEIWDQGTYSASASDIDFHVTLTDAGPMDTTYTWNFELGFYADEFDIEHDYNDGSPDWVHYLKSVPADNQ